MMLLKVNVGILTFISMINTTSESFTDVSKIDENRCKQTQGSEYVIFPCL